MAMRMLLKPPELGGKETNVRKLPTTNLFRPFPFLTFIRLECQILGFLVGLGEWGDVFGIRWNVAPIHHLLCYVVGRTAVVVARQSSDGMFIGRLGAIELIRGSFLLACRRPRWLGQVHGERNGPLQSFRLDVLPLHFAMIVALGSRHRPAAARSPPPASFGKRLSIERSFHRPWPICEPTRIRPLGSIARTARRGSGGWPS